ncbi:DNA-binding protein [Cryobacterium lactosi]|uniref:DNA-binding protein n=2 Tax=Cryobacterium lactosi TaxID=1259202 RepID=A0A4R9BK06_9MICO|nr:helix-turn-helix domain-containing protein [Cryobacterium lactosi]TFD85041.1 DNA-binding protein [Cryobacterium lactosi]
MRQIIREEVRAALLDLGIEGTNVPRHEGAPSHSARNPHALTTEDVAKMTSLPVQTLRNWRSQTQHGKPVGPRSFKMGRLVRYSEADVNAWLDYLHAQGGAS